VPDAASVAPVVPAAPPPPPVALGATGRYIARFAIVYVGLGVTLVAAIAGVVILALQPGRPHAAPWSSWRPNSGNVAKRTQEIADHVSSEYRMNAAGTPLVAVLSSTPELTQNAKVSTVSTIAIRTTPQSQSFSRIFSTSTTYQDQFCGLGTYCSIKGGKPTAVRARLVRREALEIALYTFKYVPQVGSLIAYMPPPPGQVPSTLLLLERSDFKTQLSQPLAKTLPLATPPLPSAPDTAEAARIDKLTLPLQYTFQYETIAGGTVALILASSA
jgi:hypothetical protein